MKFGVLRFPGSCDEDDALAACRRVGEAEIIWHEDSELGHLDVVVVPGGFSYGDYLRVGAIARFAPVMRAVTDFATAGGPVLGICNGFQVLCEAGLLPGALLPNEGMRFICRQIEVEIVANDTAFTQRMDAGERLSIPIKHTAGRYFASDELLDQLEAAEQIVAHYADENPNGSARSIAGVCNEQRNVVGLMPHPEHAVDPLTGSVDGLKLFAAVANARVPA